MKTKRLIIKTKRDLGHNWENYSFVATIAVMSFSVVYGLIKIFQFVPAS
jgi:hypothetical protein